MGAGKEPQHTRHPSDRWLARFYREGDDEGILDLLVQTFGSWPKHEIMVPPLEHLRWKLVARDDVRPWHIVVQDGGRIVGLSAVFRQTIMLQGRSRDAYQLVDIAVLPEYQNQGVTTAARRLAVSDRIPHLGIYMNSGARIEAEPKFRRTRRWDPVKRRDAYVEVLVLEGPATSRPHAHGSSWTIDTPAQFDDRVRLFGEQASLPYDLIDAQHREFLNWRYCDPRAGRWTVHTAEEGGRLLGYITYRVSNGWGLVGGLLALPDRLDVVESLVQEAMRSLHRQGIAAIQCWSVPQHPYRAVLRKLGIEKERRTITLVINAAGEEFTFLDDPAAAVHIVAGDTDLV